MQVDNETKFYQYNIEYENIMSSILDDMIEYPRRQKILFKTTINDFWKKVIRKLIAFIYKSNNLLNIL